jgi:[ribosomal protein S5]-alanine N-acetyltransferase
MELVAILQDGALEKRVEGLPSQAAEVISGAARMYRVHGFIAPWIAYLAMEDGACVGTCAFKGPPRNDCVEIAYYSFAEGRGVATRMASALIDIASTSEPGLLVKAQTLPQNNASTAVLRKLDFELLGPVEHPEDGTVWEWQRRI